MTRAELDAIRERAADDGDYPSPLPWVNLAIRDRRALLAEVDRLRDVDARVRALARTVDEQRVALAEADHRQREAVRAEADRCDRAAEAEAWRWERKALALGEAYRRLRERATMDRRERDAAVRACERMREP